LTTAAHTHALSGGRFQLAPSTSPIHSLLGQYNVNDMQGIQLPLRKAHERLLRKLLALPKRPAVVELLVYRWPGVRVEGYDEGWE